MRASDAVPLLRSAMDGDADGAGDGGLVGVDAENRADLSRTRIRAEHERLADQCLRLEDVSSCRGGARLDSDR